MFTQKSFVNTVRRAMSGSLLDERSIHTWNYFAVPDNEALIPGFNSYINKTSIYSFHE